MRLFDLNGSGDFPAVQFSILMTIGCPSSLVMRYEIFSVFRKDNNKLYTQKIMDDTSKLSVIPYVSPKKINSPFSNCLCFSFSKRGQVHSPSYTSFILHANKTRIHTNCTKACAPGLALKRRLKTNFKSVCYLAQFITLK